MKKFITICCLFLCSCELIQMEENLQALVGAPIEQAFYILGYPDASYRIRDVEIYVWGRSQTYSYDMPQTSTTYGRLNSFNSPFSTYYDTTTHGTEHHSGTSTCKIKVVVNKYGMIIDTEYDGGWVACDTYANRLAGY